VARDYGFDLSDDRYSFYDKSGEVVTVRIARDWYQTEEDETSFHARFDVVRSGEVTSLPRSVDERKAIEIAEKMYPIDRKASRELWETEAISDSERRMGA
jgi:hypothetical protein